jgi:hypothetical protein
MRGYLLFIAVAQRVVLNQLKFLAVKLKTQLLHKIQIMEYNSVSCGRLK